MNRSFLLAAAATLLVGAKPPPAVDYRLGLEADGTAAPTLSVEIRLEGDADGETRLALPAGGAVTGLKIDGAQVTAPDAAHRILRHRPGAKLSVRYRLHNTQGREPGAADATSALLRPGYAVATGAQVFAVPEAREGEAATFRWTRVARGWRAVSTLDTQAPRAVGALAQAVIVAAPDLQTSDSAGLRIAYVGGMLPQAEIARRAAASTAARTAWTSDPTPYLVAIVGLGGLHAGEAAATATDQGAVLLTGPQAQGRVGYVLAHAVTAAWVPQALGPTASPTPFSRIFGAGMADFLTWRALLKSDAETPNDVVERMGGSVYVHDHAAAANAAPEARGALLALKWDEAVRRKTAGKSDLGRVLRRMADHARRFPPGQAPDLATGFISAMWVEAGIDVRADLAAYIDHGKPVDLPERLYDECLEARVTVAPAFDTGFNDAASLAAQVVKGVRRRGPAWNSGLRDGMRLDSLDLHPGDTGREVIAVVRPASGAKGRGGKARTIRYWPYGDGDAESRKLTWSVGLDPKARTACALKLQGLP